MPGISEAGLSSEEAERRFQSMGEINFKKMKKFLSCGSSFHSLKVY